MASELALAMADLEEDKVQALVQAGLDAGTSPSQLLEECRQGMTMIGERFQAGQYFLSDLILSSEIFKSAAATLTAQGAAAGPSKGTIVIGTVKGDIHDIGKNIVVTLLRGAGYQVEDLGVDVPPAKFVECVKATGATVVGLSGLLTISFDPMKQTVAALKAAGLPVKVMIGGGMTNETVRQHVGADALGHDAQAAVTFANEWLAAKEVA